jgi:carboxypeptidase PM20D1
MKKLAFILFAIVGALAAVILIRTARFSSRQIDAAPIQTIAVDREAAARRLSAAIQFKTISFQEPENSGSAEFIGLRTFIEKSFPWVHRRLSKEIVGDYSLVYTWQGADNRLKPILLMAHMDVVPVDPSSESAWHHPPFSGELADGYIWGRGAMDDKASVMGILEAVENLLANHFQPDRTLYLAFGHDEEIGGAHGAAKIAELLQSRGIELEYVLDEGLNIFTGVVPDITAPVALIGVAEKGYLSLQLSAETAGGHSSAPPQQTAIGVMSRALQRLDAAPFPARLSGATRRMVEFLGPEMPWQKKLVLANLWLFEPLVRKQLAASPLTNAAIRTTAAPTIFNAGVKENVLPAKATAVINLRLLPGDTIAGATERVRRVINAPNVKITPLPIQTEPSAITDVESMNFNLIHRTIRQTAPEALVAPALLVATTDSRHYRSLTGNIFRFLPIALGPEDVKRYHGVDERIAIQDYERCIRFYGQLIMNSNQRTVNQ